MNRDDYIAAALIISILVIAGLITGYVLGWWKPNMDIVFPFN